MKIQHLIQVAKDYVHATSLTCATQLAAKHTGQKIPPCYGPPHKWTAAVETSAWSNKGAWKLSLKHWSGIQLAFSFLHLDALASPCSCNRNYCLQHCFHTPFTLIILSIQSSIEIRKNLQNTHNWQDQVSGTSQLWCCFNKEFCTFVVMHSQTYLIATNV